MFIDKDDENDEKNYDAARNLQSLAYSNYSKIDIKIKNDLLQAIHYAKEQINLLDGPLKDKTYIVNIISGGDGMMMALIYTEDDSFVHYGQRRDDGAQAIVLATCEYMLGYNRPKLRY